MRPNPDHCPGVGKKPTGPVVSWWAECPVCGRSAVVRSNGGMTVHGKAKR